MTARPVVTMDEDGVLSLDGVERAELCNPYGVKSTVWVYDNHPSSSSDLRAIADFLEQLEGANLLSGIREAGE